MKKFKQKKGLVDLEQLEPASFDAVYGGNAAGYGAGGVAVGEDTLLIGQDSSNDHHIQQK